MFFALLSKLRASMLLAIGRSTRILAEWDASTGHYVLFACACVHDGWANHFVAFGGQDVDKILLDYRHQRLGCTIIHVDDAGDEN